MPVSCASDDRKDIGICFHKKAYHPHRCVQQRWKCCNLSRPETYSRPQTFASYGWPAGSTLMSVSFWRLLGIVTKMCVHTFLHLSMQAEVNTYIKPITCTDSHEDSSTNLVPENLLELSCLFSNLTLCVNTCIYRLCQAHFVKHARRQAEQRQQTIACADEFDVAVHLSLTSLLPCV